MGAKSVARRSRSAECTLVLSRRMILFTVLMFQESTAHKHGSRTAAAVTWTLPHDRKETLDRIVEVGTVFLTVAVLIAPLTVQTIDRRCALLEGFSLLKPCIHKLTDTVRLCFVLLGSGRYSSRIFQTFGTETLVSLIASVKDSREVGFLSEKRLQALVLFMLLKVAFERDELQTAGIKQCHIRY